MLKSTLGPLSKAILEVVTDNPGIKSDTVRDLVAEAHPGLDWRKAACSNLAQKHYIVNGSEGNQRGTWYTPAAWAAKLAGLPIKPEPEAKPNWLAKPTGRIPISKETLVLGTSTPAREGAMQAFGKDCLSRDGDKFSAYTGPKPMCVGTGLGIYGPGRAGSAARAGS